MIIKCANCGKEIGLVKRPGKFPEPIEALCPRGAEPWLIALIHALRGMSSRQGETHEHADRI